MFADRPRWRPASLLRSRAFLLGATVSLLLYLNLFYLSSPSSSPAPLLTASSPFRSSYPYTRTLVIPQTETSDFSWISSTLPDLVSPAGPLTLTLYSVDNDSYPLHTPANKGHEAMAYLTYLIDSYGSFPEISIFIHGAQGEWHNNRLLDDSTPQMLRRLNLDKVAREGYVNLLCEWGSNCPAHILPYSEDFDPNKPEEPLFKDAWPDLFDGMPAPEVLAQPCCSQFAVTREKLMGVPRERYEGLRAWLLETQMEDHDSGRIFEYVWQYLWAGGPVFCPDPIRCHCELYGVCFEGDGEGDYAAYFKHRRVSNCREKELLELDDWETVGSQAEELIEGGSEEENREILEKYLATFREESHLPLDGEGMPVPGLRVELDRVMISERQKAEELRERAWEYGAVAERRIAAIEGREGKTFEGINEGTGCDREEEEMFRFEDWRER